MAFQRGAVAHGRPADRQPRGLFVAGTGAALLLGNLRRDVRARTGLAIVLGGAAIVVYNDPRHSVGDLIFTPMLFAIAWLVGFASANVAVTATIWLVLPSLLRLRLVMRSEVK